MIRKYDNTIPGAELRVIERERQKVPHSHLCPKCKRVWEHKEYFCRKMSVGYIDRDGNTFQPVPWICDECLGLNKGKGVRYRKPSRMRPRKAHTRPKPKQQRFRRNRKAAIQRGRRSVVQVS